MSHCCPVSSCIPLSNFSANGAAEGYELLIRVVQVNEDGKLTLPARELWAKINAENDKLGFLYNSANSVYDDQEDQLDTIAEANAAMSGRPWLRSLKRQIFGAVAGTGDWYITALVKAKPRIWKKVGGSYRLHEKNLRTWLATSEEGTEELNDEEGWACLSCNEDDNEEANEDDEEGRYGYDEGYQDEYDEEGQYGEDEEPSGLGEDDQALEGDANEEQAEEPVGEGGTSAGVDDDDIPKQANQTQILV